MNESDDITASDSDVFTVTKIEPVNQAVNIILVNFGVKLKIIVKLNVVRIIYL